MRKLSSILFGVIFLAACGTTSSTRVNLAVQDSVGFFFEDVRADDVRASTKSAGPGGAVTVLGDDSVTPRPADLVKTVLYRDAGQKLAGRKVQLTRFRLEITDPGGKVDDARLAATAGAPGVGVLEVLLARPIIGAIEDARAVKVVVISVSVNIDGTEVLNEYRTPYTGRVTEANLNEALLEQMRQLAAKAAAISN